MANNNEATEEGLVRGIDAWTLGANIMNMVIGAGIFVLPGIVAAQLGPAAIVAYVLCAVVVGLVFLCYAEVGSKVMRSGGSYAYIEEAFGPFAGFVSSVLLWFGWSVFGDAALAVALTSAMATQVPQLDSGLFRSGFIVVLFGFLAWINIAGLKSGVRLMVITTIGKLVPLLLLAVVGLLAIKVENLAIIEWPSLQDFGAATLVLFFAFAGAETALNSSGEIRNPARSVPLGLLLGIGAIFILYAGLQVVSQGTLGPMLGDNTEAPLSAVAEAVLGNWGGQLLLLGMLISIFGCLSGDVLNTPRVLFAAARGGLLPRALAKVHPKHNTPFVAIGFYASLGCILALSGTFKQLAVVASGSILLVYLGVSLSVLALRRRNDLESSRQFRIPGGPVVPMLSALVVAWLLFQMTASEAVGVAGLLAFTVIAYGLNRVFNKPAGPVKQ